MKKRTSIALAAAFLCLALFQSGCAFLNCYYNARTAFNKAYAEHLRDIRRVGTDSITPPPAASIPLYDRAITKAGKTITTYPRSTRWRDDAEWIAARAAFYKGDVVYATDRCVVLQKNYPQSQFVPESYVLMGRAYVRNGDYARAMAIFDTVLERFPQLDNDRRISAYRADAAYRSGARSEAAAILEAALEKTTDEGRRMALSAQLASAFIELGLFNRAGGVLDRAPQNRHYPESLYRLQRLRLTCMLHDNQLQPALDLANRMQRNPRFLVHTSDILLVKVEVLRRLNRFDEALETCDRLIAAGGVGNEVQQGFAWYAKAEIYQYNKKDPVKALDAYEKALPLLAAKAAEKTICSDRIRGLKAIAGYEDMLDTVNVAHDTLVAVHFRMGESFWLDCAEPDSALRLFESICNDTGVSLPLQTRSYYARAWIMLNMKKDTASADSLYALVIDRFPATDFAKRAQADRGDSVTIRTRADSARQELVEAENLWFEKNDAVASVNAYYKISKHYRDLSGISVKAVAAAAWLCDEVLGKKKNALTLYKQICDTWPESDYCTKIAKPKVKIAEDTLKIRALQSPSPSVSVPAVVPDTANDFDSSSAAPLAQPATAPVPATPLPVSTRPVNVEGRPVAAPVDTTPRK